MRHKVIGHQKALLYQFDLLRNKRFLIEIIFAAHFAFIASNCISPVWSRECCDDHPALTGIFRKMPAIACMHTGFFHTHWVHIVCVMCLCSRSFQCYSHAQVNIVNIAKNLIRYLRRVWARARTSWRFTAYSYACAFLKPSHCMLTLATEEPIVYAENAMHTTTITTTTTKKSVRCNENNDGFSNMPNRGTVAWRRGSLAMMTLMKLQQLLKNTHCTRWLRIYICASALFTVQNQYNRLGFVCCACKKNIRKTSRSNNTPKVCAIFVCSAPVEK